MIEPIDFDTFLKVIGGTTIISLATQISCVYNIALETTVRRNNILKRDSELKGELGVRKENLDTDKKLITNAGNIKSHLQNLLFGFTVSIVSILIFAITKHIPYPIESEVYNIFASITSYFFILAVPSWILYHVYRIFDIYFDISIEDQSSNNKTT